MVPTPGAEWRVGLSDGQFHDGQARRMFGSGGYVKYQLYTDESHTHVWADDQDQNRVSGKTDVAGNTVTLSVYGEVPPQPDARAGQYIDTVIATLYY
nr:spore coat U domain-containing protein [Candidimonas humi]